MDCSKLLKLVYALVMSCACISSFAFSINSNQGSFHLDTLFLQPNSNNLKYAVFVAGNQPYSQSWHNQSIDPGYSPAFGVGLNYAFGQSTYDASIDWLHVNTSDSSYKQASENTDIPTVEFVAPPYDVGPAVFGIKRADSTVKSNFNSVAINIGKTFTYPCVTGKIFGGINILNINQNLTTIFSDYAGSPEISDQAYALPADANFKFTTQNTSKYLGVGPNVGCNIQYKNPYGFGVVGQVAGSLTAGSISAQDSFTSTSARLQALGINPSSQSITTPTMTQLVPGFDSKLGALFSRTYWNVDLTLEGGYRFAYYINAISNINPDTLVQAGTNSTIPEFATGTMAINSTTASNGPFSLRGPYLNLTIAFA